jgi:hypothetical protein
MGRLFTIAALAAVLASGLGRPASEAAAQQLADAEKRDAAVMQLVLNSAEVVGFQRSETEIQVLYRIKGYGTLVLCSWKLKPQPTASGCISLPEQP